jgi:tRNA pseudouridine32 synthase / 23S rRNA pseudouridine746 synthase
MSPDEMVSRLLYRDGLMLVIDKPAGYAVHKGPKGGESLEDYFDALRFGLPRKPALAHRLDRDTSGCLVLGRHRKALAELGRLFKTGRVRKTYWAVVEGSPGEDEGRIELPLGRKDASRGWWMKHDPQGQSAVTTWTVLGRAQMAAQTTNAAGASVGNPQPAGLEPAQHSVRPRASGDPESHAEQVTPGFPLARERTDRAWIDPSGMPFPTQPRGGSSVTWLALEPLTGRTHQLRVHCAAMGWPIVGDGVYGHAPRSGGPPLHLHAREIVVPLYKNRDPVGVTAPVPQHMHEMLRACGWPGEELRPAD